MSLVMLLLVLTIVRGTGGDLYVILLFGGGGGVFVLQGEVLCPSFEPKDANIAASAGGYIRIARQWKFLVLLYLYFAHKSRKYILFKALSALRPIPTLAKLTVSLK